MQITLIVAVSANNVIGVDGNLPWRLADDLRHFKATTLGKPIVMGRATYESIGRALPGRQNIILSRDKRFSAAGCDVVSSRASAIAAAGDAEEIMIIGGAAIYALFLPLATCLHLTRVDALIDGDTCFPEIDVAAWRVVNATTYAAGDGNDFAFVIEKRVRKPGLVRG